MSPDRKAARLLEIVNEIDSARLLVEAAGLATECLTREEQGPLAELLNIAAQRLRQVSKDLLTKPEEQAA